MPRKFDFISPGIQLREIDQSQIANEPQDEGVLIIGQAKTGPIGKPVKVKNLDELATVFGDPQSGVNASSSDVWRSGNEQVATYGMYAAKAWLSSETSPVTYIRLGGENNPKGNTVSAGWNLNWDPDTDPAQVDLAYGLFICPSASNGATGVTGSLAAVIYTTGSAVTLSGSRADPLGTTATSSAGVFIISGGDREFKLDVYSAAGTSVSHVLNFSQEMSKVRNGSLNRNPQKLVSTNYGAANTKKHFLGESYETRLDALLTAQSASGSGEQFAILLPLISGSSHQTSRNKAATAAKTGWFINRDPNPVGNTSYDALNMDKLFRLVSLHEGTNFQENTAVRISNLSLGTNSNPNSSFSVILVSKSGAEKERFDNCNLNPADDNYVAKRIGSQYQTWNSTSKKYKVNGNYPNNSDYVYVEMYTAASTDSLKIPFGFYGPTKPKDFIMTSGSSAVTANPHRWAGPALGSALYGGNTTGAGFGVQGTNGLGEAGQVIRMQWPRLELTEAGTYKGSSYKKNQSLGIRQARSTDDTNRLVVYHQDDYKDLLRPLPDGGDIFNSSATYEYSFVFSMDEVVYSSTTGQAYYESGSHVTAETYKAGGTNALLQTAEFRSFTAPFFGGADGLDITQVDPFSSVTVLTSGQSIATNYAYYSVYKAIELTEDPELLQFDVAAVPGLTNTNLNQKLIDMSEERGDNLAIIDIDSGFKQPYENSGAEALGSVSSVLTTARTLDYNSNYAATYYPPVRLAASEGGIGVPSSVAGIGVLAQSDAASGAPWFAPAGFNRGGIKRLGCNDRPNCTGVKISAGIENLTKAERDDLYEININPIANFPGEGTVVFGQKTLQQTPSALDRINVRRLMIYLKKRIGKVAQTILFDNSVQATWTRFKNGADPILADAKSRFGISEYKLILDSTTTTPDLIDRNILYAQVFIKPARAIEFIAIDFIITKTGIEF